ncbi:hypothetical protein K1719_024199 [Acacia pycnantha]|nr:hypothetical protein K1719_024199 [Acacia pycnantha]
MLFCGKASGNSMEDSYADSSTYYSFSHLLGPIVEASQIDYYEINEAFSVVVPANQKLLALKDKPYLSLAKMVLSATITQDPRKLVQLDLHHPLFLKARQMRYRVPENLESLKEICETKVKPFDIQIKIKQYSSLHHQRVRSKTLKEFRKGEFQVLVSSDAILWNRCGSGGY